MILSISIPHTHQEYDIQVQPHQTIENIIQVLDEGGLLSLDPEHIKIKSVRNQTYLRTGLTLEQAAVYQGDTLMITQ